MSHIEEFLGNVGTPTAPRRGDISSAWDCYGAQGKSAKLYRSQIATPRRRISYYAADLAAETEENRYREVLDQLVGKQWNVYKVSPLWNVPWKETARSKSSTQENEGEMTVNVMRMLDNLVVREYDEKGLKRFARVIAGYVATHAVSGQDNPYKVEVETLKGLKGQSTDTDALQISVSMCMFDEVKLIFLGVLCGIEAAELQLKSSDVVNLPVFLTQGNVDTRERVIYGLEKSFDCIIHPLALPDVELRWMSAMWAGLKLNPERDGDSQEDTQESERDDTEESQGRKKKGPKRKKVTKRPEPKRKLEEFKMWFTLPPRDDGAKDPLRQITCTFPMEQIRTIWNEIHSSSDVEFSDNEMERFHGILSHQIKSQTHLNLDKLELGQIALPFLKAAKSGIVRIEKTDHVKVVLRYLTELCQGTMLQADPTLSSATVQYNTTMEWSSH